MALLIAVAGSATVRAQQEDSLGAEQIRASCEQGRQTLSSEAPSRAKVESIVAMQECGDSGVNALVIYWRRPSIDTVLLPALARVSAGINDRRTYQAARAIALDPGRPESFRLAALEVLVAGFDRTLAVTFPTPTEPMQTTYVGLGRIFHPPTRLAPQPVGAEAKGDLFAVLKTLASDPHERMRKVAAELGPLLQRRT